MRQGAWEVREAAVTVGSIVWCIGCSDKCGVNSGRRLGEVRSCSCCMHIQDAVLLCCCWSRVRQGAPARAQAISRLLTLGPDTRGALLADLGRLRACSSSSASFLASAFLAAASARCRSCSSFFDCALLLLPSPAAAQYASSAAFACLVLASSFAAALRSRALE